MGIELRYLDVTKFLLKLPVIFLNFLDPHNVYIHGTRDEEDKSKES